MNGFQPGRYGPPTSAWQSHSTEDGRTYYHNTSTGQTQWTKPEDLMTPGEVSLALWPWPFFHCCMLMRVIPASPSEPAVERVYCRGWPKILVQQ